MDFVLYADNHWYELYDNYLINYYHGHQPLVKERIIKQKEYKDWHELYIREHYVPFAGEIEDNDLWIAPNGDMYAANDGHATAAQDICEVLYGNDKVLYDAEYFLEQQKWIKVSDYFWNLHLNDMSQWIMTQKQANIVFDWCRIHEIKYPIDIIEII